MAEKTLDILIRARDEASRTFQKVGVAGKTASKELSAAGVAGGAGFTQGVTKQTSTLGAKLKSQFTSLGPLIGGLAAAGLAKAAIGQAEEAQKVAAQTAAVLKSTGQAAGVSADHVEGLAQSLSKVAAVDDEVIQQGENVLLTFTNVRNEVGKGNDIFDQATKAALDLSAGMGQDLQSSVVQLGKALADPIKGVSALTRVGVDFTQQQKDQIKTLVESGQTLEAQKVILARVNQQFQGDAAANATASDKLKVAFGNIEEELGKALLPLVKTAAGVLNALAPVIEVVADHAGTLLTAFLGYKAIQFLPTLLQGVGLAASRLGLKAVADTATKASMSLSGLSKSGAGLAAGAFAIGIPLVTEAIQAFGFESQKAKERAQEFLDELSSGKTAAQIRAGILAILPDLIEESHGLLTREEALKQLNEGLAEAHHQLGIQQKQQAAEAAAAADKTKKLGDAADDTGKAFRNKLGPAMDQWARNSPFTQAFISRAQEFFQTQIDGIEDAKKAWADWRASTASTLNFAGNAVQDFITAQGEAKAATQALRDAQQQAGEVALQGAQAQRDAAQQVVSAEQALKVAIAGVPAALARVKDAQEALNEARQEAVRNLQDMRSAEAHGALGVKEAQLSVLEAKKALRALDEKGTPHGTLEYREAVLRLQEAELSLTDAQRENKRNHEDLRKAEKAGIKGSEAVQSAQDALKEAYDGVSAAQAGVAEATKGLREAQKNQAAAARDAAQANRDVAASVRDAAAALATIQSQSSLGGLAGNLDQNIARMKIFGENLRTIAADGGRGAQELVKQFLAAGPAAFDFLDKFAHASSDVRHDIEQKIGKALRVAEDQATKLQRALVNAMKAAADELKTVAGQLRAIVQHFRDLKNMGPVDVAVTYHLQTVGDPPPGTPGNVHNPQIAAASGFDGIVRKPTWIHVAEAGFPEEVHIGRVAPGGGGGSNGSSGRAAVLEIKPDRRRFVQADNYELRYGGA